MVMAGNDSTPGLLAEEPLTTRLEYLRQRREALQEKLAQKNNELKNLCVEEAELTGVLPPEIPLEPGETPPVFRRKVFPVSSYPQNLINKLKTNDAEESALELERQVQMRTLEFALATSNDLTKSKAIRRKHRLLYQQTQQKLQELEVKLNFIRQTRGKYNRLNQYQHGNVAGSYPHLHTNVKHRTKKPRPPLESTGSESSVKSTQSAVRENESNFDYLSSEPKPSVYHPKSFEEHLTVSNVYNHNNRGTYPNSSPVNRQPSQKIIEHDYNDNHNVYILPDQYRTRTYSHGSGGSRSQIRYQEIDRNYRPVPNTYYEDERQIRIRQLQQQKQHQQQDFLHGQHQLSDVAKADIEIQRKSMHHYPDKDYRGQLYAQGPDYNAIAKAQSQVGYAQKVCNPSPDGQIPKGYWMRYNDEIVWCSDDPQSEKFGSLDRRKCTSQYSYHSVTTKPSPSPSTSSSSSTVPRQHHPTVHLLPLIEQIPSSNRMLLRTQSLGSVETWYNPSESPQDKDSTDSMTRKPRQKEWYETSLDTNNANHDHGYVPLKKNVQPSPPPIPSSSTKPLVNDDSEKFYSHTRYEPPPLRPRVLEIPAESKPPDNDDPGQNCTIVQAGKCQPYREITKPFEMSDFYKYSTKFRKANNNLANGNSEQKRDVKSSADPMNDQNLSVQNGTLGSPVQKRIYQPVQRMTCQPYMTTLR